MHEQIIMNIRLVIFAAILLTACSKQTSKNESTEDTVANAAEVVQEEKYYIVESASQADIIDFVADGSFTPLQVSKGRPREIWKCKINARMERLGMACQFKVHSEVWEEGSSECKSQVTEEYTGHWTVKAVINGRRANDWYYYTGVNDKGDKFVFRVLTSFKKGNTEMRAYPFVFKISNVEMKKNKEV